MAENLKSHCHPAIELQALTKNFGRGRRRVEAVRGIDLKVEAGQVFGFLGANGAGKSTTIRMIVDLVRPTAGHIRLFGKDLAAAPQVLKRVGALVEGALFYPHLSGRANLRVLAQTIGGSRKGEIDELLERLDMTARADRPVDGYSMGMKQRLGVAAALLGRPDLVILDEPTNGLDPAGIREMRDFIRQLVDDQGLTVFLSSHLLSEVEQVCDQVAILHHGKIVRQGRVGELLKGSSALSIEATPLDSAASILAETWPVEHQEGVLRAEVPEAATPEVVRRLTAAEIDVFAIHRQQRNLEQYFFEVTAGQERSSGHERSLP